MGNLFPADALRTALRRIGREDVLREMGKDEKAIDMDASSASHASLPTTTASTSTGPVTAATASVTRAYVQAEEVIFFYC